MKSMLYADIVLSYSHLQQQDIQTVKAITGHMEKKNHSGIHLNIVSDDNSLPIYNTCNWSI